MSDNVFARTLARAIELEGSRQSIAHLLRVPEATLLRWCQGRADMPVRAFRALIDFLTTAEVREAANEAQVSSPVVEPSSERLEFRIGTLTARCRRCECMEFRRLCSDQPLRMTSQLVCRACGHEIAHGDLLVELGHELIARKRLEAVARNRRQAAMRAGRRTKVPGDEVV